MKQFNQESRLGQGATYHIRVQGRLDEAWSDWFYGMAIAFEGGITTIAGTVIDQVALRGILSQIWDLNLTVISVTRVERDGI